MAETLLTVFENFTGIDVRDIVDNSEPEGSDNGILDEIQLEDLEAFLAERERQEPIPIYDPRELVPRIWPIRQYEPDGNGYPLTADVIHPIQACAALLYAHKVEIPNPLLAALRSDWPPPVWQLRRALWALYKLSPLLEGGLVLIGRIPMRTPDKHQKEASRLIESALHMAKGRAAYLELLPILSRYATDAIGSDQDSPSVVARRIRDIEEARLSDINEARESGIFQIEVDEMLESLANSHADVWLPYPAFLDLIAAAHDIVTKKADPVLTWTVTLSGAYLNELDLHDQISIRLNSAAFEGWRSALQASFEDLQSKSALGLMSEANVSAAELLRGSAELVLEQLRPDLRNLWRGVKRDMTVGLAAAAPGAAVSDLKGALVGGVGGAAAGAVVGAAWDLLGPSSRRRSAGALRRHAIALGKVISTG